MAVDKKAEERLQRIIQGNAFDLDSEKSDSEETINKNKKDKRKKKLLAQKAAKDQKNKKGSAGFRAISRDKFYSLKSDNQKSSIAVIGHYRPKFDQVDRRVSSAVFRPVGGKEKKKAQLHRE